MRLRIAHITATFPPYRGGTGNVCYHNARELARRGHRVHVFTAALAGAAPFEERDGFTIRRLRPLARVGNAPLLPGLLPALRGFDILHLHYPFILGAELVRLAAFANRTPLVISHHNDLIGDGMRAALFAAYQRLSAFITVRGAARMCAVSLDHYQSSRLCGALPDGRPPAVELPNGVAVDQFRPGPADAALRLHYGIPPGAPLLLFVAALDRAHHFKGLGRLLQVLALLPEIWLLVVGDGDLRPAYAQQARDCGVTARVVFAGAVDHAATPPFFRSAAVTVLPSTPPESFGLVLIESLACGTPVVASNIPGVRTVVDHGGDGLLVAPDDSAGLAAAIRRIVAHEDERRRMGERGRARVAARYAWPAIGARLEGIYQQVITEAPARRLAAGGEL